MEYLDYITGIDFRDIKPETPLQPQALMTWLQDTQKNIFLDLDNTILPEEESLMKNRLKKICGIPRMSTFAVAAMINYGVSQMPDAYAFVNVGIWHGFTLLAGMLDNAHKTCIGIDNFSQFSGKDWENPKDSFLERFKQYQSPSHHFFEMDYQEYFLKHHQKKIGFYIYDGEHSYDNQLKGLQIAEPFFSENCLVLVDDTNWDEPHQATLDFIANSSNAYQVLLDRKTYSNAHPTLWNGIMIIQRIKLK